MQYRRLDAQLLDSEGQVILERKSVEGPVGWSDQAIEMAAFKYFRQGDMEKPPVKGRSTEFSVAQVFDRVLSDLEDFAVREKFLNRQKAKILSQEMLSDLYLQRISFNSPVWFNCGLSRYGIKSAAHRYHWQQKTKKISVTLDGYLYPQLSACFIQSVEDDIEGIFTLLKNEASVFKYGSGSGTNFSTLRSRFEKLSGGGHSPGLIAFLGVFDRAAGVIKSGGTTRRAAKMVVVDVDHLEIEEFIDWKSTEEKKAMRLKALGFESSYEGEIESLLTGQNSNNSVRVNDKFMNAVLSNADWSLVDKAGAKVKQVKASMLFEKMAKAAWFSADPGIQFHDTINKWHTCKHSGLIRASNPCSEFMFLDNSACNLASLNLLKFLSVENKFLVQDFIKCVERAVQYQDIIVDRSGYPTAEIALNSHNFRPLGLGFTGLGAFLIRKGLAYNSEKAHAWASFISSLMTAVAFRKSGELAKKLGAFKEWQKNKKEMAQVISLHKKAATKIDFLILDSNSKKELEGIWKEVAKMSTTKGFRNSQVTLIAPTGTTSFVLDADTQGIEPEFSFFRTKNLSGGGQLKISSQSLEPALQFLGYDAGAIERILKWGQHNSSLSQCPTLKSNHKDIFLTAHEISPLDHLKMMAAVQPHISGAISKTVNLPENIQVKDIQDLYLQAWQLGLKSVAVYRDKSKLNQPLNPQQSAVIENIGCMDCGS